MKTMFSLMLGVSALAAAAAFTTAPTKAASFSQQHIDWCTLNHGDYSASTNMYTGKHGMERACASPYDDQNVVTVANPTVDLDMDMDNDARQAHIDWCLRMHTNYRVSDNTYKDAQNRRKLCQSPYN